MALILVIRNVSAGLPPVSDYTYEVMVGDGTRERSTVLASGTIRAHTRADGWHALVARVLAVTDDATIPRQG